MCRLILEALKMDSEEVKFGIYRLGSSAKRDSRS
jgi:hypothetical protein